MNFHILTLFPDMVMQGLSSSITGRAIQQNKITVKAVDIRDFSKNKHRKVDDYTYGGGAGMLMQAAPVYDAWESVCSRICAGNRVRTVYVTPQGRRFDQRMAADFAKEEDLVILCGHYEGVDERVLEEIVTDYVSIGDFVLTGGELAAMVIVDAVSRLVPGVLHNEESAQTETFDGDLLEYPQYTQPRVWHDKTVPEVLLSGNEKKIRSWRLEQSVARTKENRPDLYAKYERLQQCKALLMRQKILHIDMIELINRRRAEILFWEGTEVLLRDMRTGVCFHTCMEISRQTSKRMPEGQQTSKQAIESQQTSRQTIEERTSEQLAEQLKTKQVVELQFYKKISPDDLNRIECILVHQSSCANDPWMLQHFHVTSEYYQVACTRREMLPVSGLYRADGAPMESGPNAGMQIRRVTEEYTDIVTEHYHLEHDRAYVEERIASGAVYGAFFGKELAGFIGYHSEGSCGMLEVFPQYRHRHIALALETYITNLAISRGEIAYGQVMPGNAASMELQRRMGASISRTPVYWMDKNGGVGFWKAVL